MLFGMFPMKITNTVRATGTFIYSFLCPSKFFFLGGGHQLIFADIGSQGHGDHENQKDFLVIVDKGIGKTTKPAGCRSRHLYIGKYREIMKNALF